MHRGICALVVLAAVAPTAHAGRCSGAFRRSCLNELYRCFDAQGGCRVETIPTEISAGYTVTCFDNGARVVTSVGISSPTSPTVEGSSELFNAAGEKCVSSLASSDRRRGTTDIDLVNVQSGQQWHILYTRNRMIVYCPNRRRRGRNRVRIERYTLRQAQTADCGSGNGDCVPGNCGP